MPTSPLMCSTTRPHTSHEWRNLNARRPRADMERGSIDLVVSSPLPVTAGVAVSRSAKGTLPPLRVLAIGVEHGR